MPKSEKLKQIIWPKVSFILPTFNDQNGVERCIESLWKQNYPKKLIDLVVVDNGSSDQSVEVAKKMGARVFVYPRGTVYSNWVKGMKQIRGDYFFYLEQDIILRRRDFIKEMIRPMLSDNRIIATFTKEYPKKDMHWVTRFLSYHYSQCDPLLEFLFDKLENKIIEHNNKWFLCKFDEKLQPACRMFYRVSYLKKTSNWKAKNYFDHDFVMNCILAGYPYFAYVPEAGYYHYHVKNLGHLLRKRVRNMHMHYFDNHDTGSYQILNINDKKSVLKLIAFFIYANLFFPALIRGFIRFINYKDLVLLTEPIITACVADALLWEFLRDVRGRNYILKSLKTVVS